MFYVLFPPSSALRRASQRYKLSVYRRYSDFDVFHEVLLQRFAYRMVPAMPPKRMLKGGESPLCVLHIGWLSSRNLTFVYFYLFFSRPIGNSYGAPGRQSRLA